jgi:membrane-bound lytic murein transglycosylase A
MKKNAALIITIVLLFAALIGGVKRLALIRPSISVAKASFTKLPAWNSDNHAEALTAFLHSCQEILKRDANAHATTTLITGEVRDWQTACNAASKVNVALSGAARIFFETWFEPYQITDSRRPAGLFTGYYLPLLHASLVPDKHYFVPIYGLPNDLIKINLGLFRHDLDGITLIAQQRNNQLYPYPERASIIQGAINKNANILAWADNQLDVFFAQIQGSAMLELPNQQRLLISYAGTNGRPYTAIGNVLIAKNVLTKQNVSMQTIRQWLEAHPLEATAVLNQNASFVFFNLSKTMAPVGSEHVPLLPMRSLAVDNSIIPLGAPLWINTYAPRKTNTTHDKLQRLLIAQDSGGAIKGALRGDVYWGAGADAAFSAGHMQSPGQLWILLPKKGVPQ